MRKRFLLPTVLLAMTLCACNARMEDYSYPEPEGNVTEVTLSETAVSISQGQTVTVNAFLEGEGSITWVNGNPNVVSIFGSEDSVSITGLATGEAYVTAIAGSKSASVKVTVNGGGGSQIVVVNSVALSDVTKTIDVGQEFELIATPNVTGSPTPAVTWSTSNSNIASIVANGNKVVVKGESAGEVTIKALCGGKQAECSVTVEGDEVAVSIRLNKSTLSLKEGGNETLVATVKPSDAIVVWQSSNTAAATVEQSGKVTAQKAGVAVISATITVGTEIKTAECNVTVTSNAEQDDYAKKVSAWSQKGHIYFHYLRNTDTNYDKWAIWLWNSYPVDDEGVLFGANHAYTDGSPLKAVGSYGWMKKSECGETGDAVYSDEYGQIVDIDLTKSYTGGKTNQNVKLISSWEELNKNNIGFLIVDQTKMDGSTMWVSDGGAEVYIKKIGKYMENGADSYLHVYCVEGNVSGFKLASGKQEVVNPTLTDQTGQYRSNADITNLRADAFSSGVSTSETFLNDKPGVGYQIFVPSFCDSDGDGFGDLQGIISKLQYLDDLGVKVLWLTPIQESNSYHGYDVTDYYKIDSRFGTLQDYQELIYKAHQRGMKVLMDMVINHTSKSNVLFQKSQNATVETINGKQIKYRDMYLWKYKGDKVRVWDEKDPTTSAGIQSANFVTKNVEEVSDWYKDGTSDYYYFGKFGSGMAELNYSAQATRDYMTEMCKYWMSFGLDGFRLDAIKHIYLLAELDPSTPLSSGTDVVYDVGWKHYYNSEMDRYVDVPNDYSYDRKLNVMFWKQFAGSLKAAYPNCFLVGENFDGWNERMAPFYEALDSQFDFQTYYQLNEKKGDAIGDGIKTSLQVYQNNANLRNGKAINGAFTSNHDVSRMLNHAVVNEQSVNAKYASQDAIHYGDVNTSNLTYANNTARYYAAISILTPGVSWIYYGDEIGICGNVNDKVPDSKGNIVDDHGNNTDRWYRQPMRWGATYGQDGVVKYQFSGMEVLWDKISNNVATVPQQEADPNSMLSYFKLLTAVKNDSRYPTYGSVIYSGALSGDPWTTWMQISDGVHSVCVGINNTNSTKSFDYMGAKGIIGKSANSGQSGNTFNVGAYGFLVVEI